MRKLLSGRIVTVFCVALLGILVPRAHATQVDFACSGMTAACGGTVTFSSGDYSGSGISVINTTGQYPTSMGFALVFDTGAKTISLTSGSIVLSGVIQSLTVSGGTTTTLIMHVFWNNLSMATAVQTALGTPQGIDAVSVTYNGSASSSGSVSGVTIAILATPEPASLALLGSGLLMAGGFLRRRWTR
ncbi:MAG TPA: PEP-CTERM sorting domain-containing protein [Candidatus Acidoferrales bacterium]|nr:PEP-CTERM sorting domain-containing protein [Candidatus Acidoferrales bacterium]